MANLVVGKFYPPHLGHHYLINKALEDGPTVVMVLWSEQEHISGWHRQHWLRQEHPDARVLFAQDEFPVNYHDDEAWNNHVGVMKTTLHAYGFGEYTCETPIDRVFGSEKYIPRLARNFDAEPVIVDLDRQTVPISGTAVRDDVRGNWTFLRPSIRAGLCKRIVCVGAESCGTTTLARDLAEVYDTVWVPEYGRTYSEGILDKTWTHRDLEHIAGSQRELEDALAYHAEHGILICDTNTLATRIWDEFLVGPSDIRPDPADLFILTDLCPWEDDGLRFGREYRHDMQNEFRAYLAEGDSPWVEVTGQPHHRLDQAVGAIDALTWEFATLTA